MRNDLVLPWGDTLFIDGVSREAVFLADSPVELFSRTWGQDGGRDVTDSCATNS